MLAEMKADMKNPLDLYVDGKPVTKSPLPAFYKCLGRKCVFCIIHR